MQDIGAQQARMYIMQPAFPRTLPIFVAKQKQTIQSRIMCLCVTETRDYVEWDYVTWQYFELYVANVFSDNGARTLQRQV